MLYRAFFCTRMTISHKQVIHVFPTICISLNIFIIIIEIKKHRFFVFKKKTIIFASGNYVIQVLTWLSYKAIIR